jgi:hypothetical protein
MTKGRRERKGARKKDDKEIEQKGKKYDRMRYRYNRKKET